MKINNSSVYYVQQEIGEYYLFIRLIYRMFCCLLYIRIYAEINYKIYHHVFLILNFLIPVFFLNNSLERYGGTASSHIYLAFISFIKM